MLVSSLVLSALVAGSFALPASSDYVVHEKRTEPPSKQLPRRQRVSEDLLIPIRIGLKQNNVDKGYDYLMEVSNPKSLNYGKHLSLEEVNSLFAPSPESVEEVKTWLAASGISVESIEVLDKGWVAFDLHVKDAEVLFQTEYYEHEVKDGRMRIGSDAYSLPKHISRHVDYIKPGVMLSPPLTKRCDEHEQPGQHWPHQPHRPTRQHGPPRYISPWTPSSSSDWSFSTSTTKTWSSEWPVSTSSSSEAWIDTTCTESASSTIWTSSWSSDSSVSTLTSEAITMTTTSPVWQTISSKPFYSNSTVKAPFCNTTSTSTGISTSTDASTLTIISTSTDASTSTTVSTSQTPVPSNCGTLITPECIRALYNIPMGTRNDTDNMLGIYEGDPSYAQEDLDLFFSTYAPYIPEGTTPVLDSFSGGVSPGPIDTASTEADLDFEIAYPLVWPQQVAVFDDGHSASVNEDATFLTTFLDVVDGSFCNSVETDAGIQCGSRTLTRVLSVSYGFTELQMSQAAQERVCNEIMKLSLQGHTFVFASGDYGVATTQPAEGETGCYDPASRSDNGLVFNPWFPSTCPWVLAVGATMLTAGQNPGDPESVMFFADGIGAANPALGVSFSSTGGFSNFFPVPDYQTDAVSTYFAQHDPGYASYTYNGDLSSVGANGGLYNRGGRGIPDLSANGVNIAGIVKGAKTNGDGTSLSAPIVASIITLINGERAAAGKSPVGFLHPVLYQHPEAFNDITVGKNPGCKTDGFSAVPGWDPVTGLGTPDYAKLLDIFMSLP